MERKISRWEERMVNRVANSTLAKLTNDEAQMLVGTRGFGYYKGELKTRYNGMKRVSDGTTYTFIGNKIDYEFTKLADDKDEPYWVLREYNKELECYEDYVQALDGVYFIR